MKVLENDLYKVVAAPGYNMTFNKQNGQMCRWGETLADDPVMAPAPEILDLEISTGDCSGKCAWCYKSNTVSNGKHMSFETFKQIIDKFPTTLTQVALGLTDIDANPDLVPILEYCRELGIVPNFTTAGYGLTSELLEICAGLVGAVAVSVYPHNKEIAYETAARFLEAGVEQTNVHLLYYLENLDHVQNVIYDYQDGGFDCNAIVLLALKQKGRGAGLTPLPQEDFDMMMQFVFDRQIPVGFDSCSAPKFEKWALENGKDDLLVFSEPCESALMSAYVNVEGMFYPCSFTEDVEDGLDVLNCDNFLTDIWNHPKTQLWQDKLLGNCRNCPVFEV